MDDFFEHGIPLQKLCQHQHFLPAVTPTMTHSPPLQEMMRDFLEREKRKQAEREAAKAEKQAAQQTA
jgi:hypothetical protein